MDFTLRISLKTIYCGKEKAFFIVFSIGFLFNSVSSNSHFIEWSAQWRGRGLVLVRSLLSCVHIR